MPRSKSPFIIDRRNLVDLDEARIYAAASSYNSLNEELGRIVQAAKRGRRVIIEDEAGRFSLWTVHQVRAWIRGRFPHAKPTRPE